MLCYLDSVPDGSPERTRRSPLALVGRGGWGEGTGPGCLTELRARYCTMKCVK